MDDRQLEILNNNYYVSGYNKGKYDGLNELWWNISKNYNTSSVELLRILEFIDEYMKNNESIHDHEYSFICDTVQ